MTSPEAPEAVPLVVSPELVAMEDALDRGDHVATRDLARTLAASDDAKLRAAGVAMLERLRPDPVIVAVLAGTGLLIVTLAVHFLGAR